MHRHPWPVALAAAVTFAGASASFAQSPAPNTELLRLKSLEADAPARVAAIEAGRKFAQFCANCHGDDGNSNNPEVPTLAGQNASYILTEIEKFGSGERKYEFMQGLIKVMSPQDRLHLALFFSAAKTKPALAKAAPAVAARGHDLFEKHCSMCHGEFALGNEAIPRLAGQQPAYIEASLRHFRDRTGERVFAPMTTAAGALSDTDIEAVATYLASRTE